MRIVRFVIVTTVVSLLATTVANAQDAQFTDSHRAAVAKLMAITHVRELTEGSTESILAVQLKQMPQLAPYAGVLRDFYHEQLNWTVLEPEYTRLYLEVFSEDEMRDLVQF